MCGRTRALALALAALVAPAVARAQDDCAVAPPDLYPADGAPGVPVNGIVRVVFHEPYAPELPLEEVLRLYVEQTDQQVPGAVTIDEDRGDTRIELRTTDPLAPQSQYRAVVVLPGFAGEQEFGFRTGGDVIDTSAPAFDGASGIRVVPADNVACSEPRGPVPSDEEDLDVDGRGYRVTVSFPPAQDQAGAANIDYLLVQTSGPTIDEPWLRKRVRAAGTGDLFGAVFLPRKAVARQEVCFEVHAEDMFGNRVEPGREACGDPIGPGYFRSMCTVAAVGAPSSGALALLVAAAGLSLARRRSRSRSSPRPRP